MADLSELRRRLIAEAEEDDQAPPLDASWGALVSRLTQEAAIAPPIEQPAPERRPGWRTAIVVVLVAIAAALAWPRAPEPEPTMPAPAPSHAPAAPAPTPSSTPAAVQRPTPEDLAALLDDAEAALDIGDPERALALLERHAERAPLDARAPDRMVLRILALCALDRTALARSEARAFRAGHHASTMGARLDRSCVDR